jgi:4-hydroxyphenylpyruvate dioxygenase-like putative hemolysin
MRDWIEWYETLTDEEKKTLEDINDRLTHAVRVLGIVSFQEALDYTKEALH